jgi:hypothetical protein
MLVFFWPTLALWICLKNYEACSLTFPFWSPGAHKKKKNTNIWFFYQTELTKIMEIFCKIPEINANQGNKS